MCKIHQYFVKIWTRVWSLIFWLILKVKLRFVLHRLSVFVNLRRRYCPTGWAKNFWATLQYSHLSELQGRYECVWPSINLPLDLTCCRAKYDGSAAMSPTAESLTKYFAPLSWLLPKGVGTKNDHFQVSPMWIYRENFIQIRPQLSEQSCAQTNERSNEQTNK